MKHKLKQTALFDESGLKIRFIPKKCTGCGSCELMCSLLKEGVGGPALSRCRIGRDPFNHEFTFNVCRQCLAPSCYAACPERDKALLIDPETGVRHIDKEECIGCYKCVQACPFDESLVKFNRETKKAYMCNLCIDRPQGPICIEYCPTDALELVTRKTRKIKGDAMSPENKKVNKGAL